MLKLAEKLSGMGYNARYNKEINTIEIAEKNMKIYHDGDFFRVGFVFEEQYFEQLIKDYVVLNDFLEDFLSGVIKLKRYDDKNISMIGWVIRKKERQNKKLSIVRKIFDWILAIVLIGFSLPLAIGTFVYVDFTSIECLSEATPLALGAGGLALAISLIHHALTKNPLKIGGVVLYGLGVNISWFALAMLMVTFGEIHESTLSETIGMTVLFLFVLAFGILFIVLGLRFDKNDDNQKKNYIFMTRVPELPSGENIRKIVNAVEEKMKKETILIKPNIEKNPTIFDSKLGGLPYWDLSMPFPVDSNNEKMQLLAQFNLEEMPETEKLPKNGILQVFISYNDECKVIWHREVNRLIKESDIESLEMPSYDFIDGECGIDFEKIILPVVYHNPESTKIMREVAENLDITLDKTLEFYELFESGEKFEYNYSECSYLLGNPYFINYDDVRPENSRYNTLLFQLESISNDRFSTYWGDCGIVYFFIEDYKLSEKNFDDVYFNYDSY